MEGKHAATDCRLCHLNTRLPTDFIGIATTCVGCHQADDMHQGAYGSDCADHIFKGTPTERYTCYNCHAHAQAATLAEHRKEGTTENIDDCLHYHATGH